MCIRDSPLLWRVSIRGGQRRVDWDCLIYFKQPKKAMTPLHIRTPLWESPTLSQILGAEVLLKMEAVSYTHLDVYKRQG